MPHPRAASHRRTQLLSCKYALPHLAQRQCVCVCARARMYIHTYIPHTYIHTSYIHTSYIHIYLIHTYIHTHTYIHRYIHTYLIHTNRIHTYLKGARPVPGPTKMRGVSSSATCAAMYSVISSWPSVCACSEGGARSRDFGRRREPGFSQMGTLPTSSGRTPSCGAWEKKKERNSQKSEP